jgi:hypothetical protein
MMMTSTRGGGPFDGLAAGAFARAMAVGEDRAILTNYKRVRRLFLSRFGPARFFFIFVSFVVCVDVV